MKTFVEFRSTKFPPYENEEKEINPGLWGKKLAEYLVEKLTERSMPTREIEVEDWGCFIPLENVGFRLGLGCGHRDGNDDEFLCFTEPSTPIVKKNFRKIDASLVLNRLTETLHEILSEDPEIHDIMWSEPKP